MYHTNPSSYAKRATQLLASNEPADLLYAVLEIRMGVEARLHSYIQASEEVNAALKKGWEIPKLFKGLEKTFSNSRQVMELVISSESTPPLKLHFIPISNRLRKFAERSGDVLHHSPKREQSEKWWSELRERTKSALVDLNICASASLLGVPLMNPRTNQFTPKFLFPSGDPRLQIIQDLARTQGPHGFMISYLSTEGYYQAAR